MQQNITFSFDSELDTNFNWKKYIDEECIEITLESGHDEEFVYKGKKKTPDLEDSFSLNSHEFRRLKSMAEHAIDEAAGRQAKIGALRPPYVPHDSESS